MLGWLVGGTIWVGGSWVVLVGLLYVFQRRLIWPKPSTLVDPGKYGALVIVIDAERGQDGKVDVEKGPIGTAYFRPHTDTVPVLVFFHGNADQIGMGGSWVGRSFNPALGVGFFAIEYPGYPLSKPGKISEQSAYEAAERALRYLTSSEGLGIHRDRVILFGQSIGCAVAIEMASRGWGRKLILTSPFLSLSHLLDDLLPFFLRWTKHLLVDKLANDDRIISVTIPVCVLHGDQDELVPFHHGEELARLLPEGQAELHSLPGIGHNDVFVTSRRQVVTIVKEFINA